MQKLNFWYEFGSTYSYPAAMRAERVAGKAGVEIIWRPFLLGPIFKLQGWATSPFNIYPAKGKYMWRDMERICAELAIPFQEPDLFPQNGLLAARVALTNALGEHRAVFSRAVYTAEFGEGRKIEDAEVIRGILSGLNLPSGDILDEANGEETKRRLKEETQEATRLEIFGAPSFIAEDGEMFWGNDRLEQAVNWCSDTSSRMR